MLLVSAVVQLFYIEIQQASAIGSVINIAMVNKCRRGFNDLSNAHKRRNKESMLLVSVVVQLFHIEIQQASVILVNTKLFLSLSILVNQYLKDGI